MFKRNLGLSLDKDLQIVDYAHIYRNVLRLYNLKCYLSNNATGETQNMKQYYSQNVRDSVLPIQLKRLKFLLTFFPQYNFILSTLRLLLTDLIMLNSLNVLILRLWLCMFLEKWDAADLVSLKCLTDVLLGRKPYMGGGGALNHGRKHHSNTGIMHYVYRCMYTRMQIGILIYVFEKHFSKLLTVPSQ